MEHDILALLQLFDGKVPDQQAHDMVFSLARDRQRWGKAHDLFNQIRTRNLAAISAKDGPRECQYCFEEICLKCLYNESDSMAPFDSDSPHWITKNAIALARRIGIPIQSVIDVVAPVRGS